MDTARAPRSRIYDGGFYARVMDPFMVGLHGYVADHVEPGMTVVDAGCGTGSLVFRLAPTAKEVLGVDLSPAMVEYAQQRLESTEVDNVSFALGDLSTALADRPDDSFDLATLLMVLHEMPNDARVPVLTELARVAREVMVVDFRVPMPWSFTGLRNRFIELTAGLEHFNAFRDFTRRGGTAAIAATAELPCEHVRFLDAGTLEIHRIKHAE
ncbi:MAG: class I SAM-dependent methyltransferase [Deltaproteobacteria bacterium]|nr:class I SAM-dependent methyltransferase [Deltaproteobacteria bacterium]MBW2254951.1 class I SAM-dependent methyltransferase [Deltaproteobacteria bacterium]